MIDEIVQDDESVHPEAVRMPIEFALDELYYKVREERERAGTDKDPELLHYDQRCSLARQLQTERAAHERTRAELERRIEAYDLAVNNAIDIANEKEAELESLRSGKKDKKENAK